MLSIQQHWRLISVSATLMAPPPVVVIPEDTRLVRRPYEELPRLAVPLFGPLPEGCEIDPWDPAGQAD